jgi:hypothetical protein
MENRKEVVNTLEKYKYHALHQFNTREFKSPTSSDHPIKEKEKEKEKKKKNKTVVEPEFVEGESENENEESLINKNFFIVRNSKKGIASVRNASQPFLNTSKGISGTRYGINVDY